MFIDFEKLKQSLDLRDVAAYYGVQANKSIDVSKALEKVLTEFGAERVCAVLASHINVSGQDGRISQANKSWAERVRVPNRDKYTGFSAHATVINAFADDTRKMYEQTRDVFEQQLIGKKLHLRGEGEPAQMYEILGVNADGSVNIERDDSWTFRAVGLKFEDGAIHWDYSTDGQFVDEARLQTVLEAQKNPRLNDNRADEIYKIKHFFDDPSLITQEAIKKLPDKELSDLFQYISNELSFNETSKTWNEKYNLVGNEVVKRDDRLVDTYEKAKERQENQELKQPPEQAAKINQTNTQEEKKMEQNAIQANPRIRATAYLVENAGALKANATVSVNDTMVVRNIKIVEGEKGLIVNMPSRKVGDEWKDVAVPASPEAVAQIKVAVLEAYEKAVELDRTGVESPKPELNPAFHKLKLYPHIPREVVPHCV
jgi:stage V sporulation protein G